MIILDKESLPKTLPRLFSFSFSLSCRKYYLAKKERGICEGKAGGAQRGK